MKGFIRIAASLGLMAASLSPGVASAADPKACEPLKIGSMAPPFSISMSDGSEGVVLRKALEKKTPVVVVFWAYHCKPCVQELPQLQRLSDELGDKVSFLLIHDGPDESLMKAKLAELKVTHPSASDDTRAKEERYCVNDLPRTFVVDRDGIVRAELKVADEQRLRSVLVALGVVAAKKD